MTASPPPPPAPSPQPRAPRLARPPLPGLRLPVGPKRAGLATLLSFGIHAVLIAALVIGTRSAWLEPRPAGSDARPRSAGGGGGGGGGGGAGEDGARTVNFFTLPAARPQAVDVAAPRVAVSDLAMLRAIPVDLPALALARAPLAVPDGPGAGRAGVGGRATGSTDAGSDLGPGTGGEGGYIFGASPRTAILPPLTQVPGSVAGRTYRVLFWVAADGRVTRVDVDPPIRDAEYGREFRQRMLAYQFYPAHTRDGQNVASVVPVTLRIGN